MPTKQTESAPSFLRVYTQVRRDHMKHSFLRQISACVDWRGIRTLLNKKYTKTQNAIGNSAYDALMMFKILLLQTWYGLSDYEVEERINDSLLFSEFPLLDMGLPAPDHSTICRFRAELTRLGIMDKLLRELNKQFKKHGISRIDQGAIHVTTDLYTLEIPCNGLQRPRPGSAMYKTCRVLMALLLYGVVWEVEHRITLEAHSSSEGLDSLFGIGIELDDDLL